MQVPVYSLRRAVILPGEKERRRRATMEFLMQPIRRYVDPCFHGVFVSILRRLVSSLKGSCLALNQFCCARRSRRAWCQPVSGHGGMVAEQQRPVGSADTQIMAVNEEAANRRENSPPTSELSMGKTNPRAPGWNKRSVRKFLSQRDL